MMCPIHFLSLFYGYDTKGPVGGEGIGVHLLNKVRFDYEEAWYRPLYVRATSVKMEYIYMCCLFLKVRHYSQSEFRTRD